MNHHNEQQSYEIFIEMLSDLLLEQLQAGTTRSEERGNNDQNETGA